MAIPRALDWILKPDPGKELGQRMLTRSFPPRELLTGGVEVPDEGPSQGGKGGLQCPCDSWSQRLSLPALSGCVLHTKYP